jgi:hypothetical protein
MVSRGGPGSASSSRDTSRSEKSLLNEINFLTSECLLWCPFFVPFHCGFHHLPDLIDSHHSAEVSKSAKDDRQEYR